MIGIKAIEGGQKDVLTWIAKPLKNPKKSKKFQLN